MAVQEYLDYKTITTSKTKDVVNVTLPDIFICLPDGGFNNTKADENGYKHGKIDFLSGVVNNSNDSRSWEGATGIPYDNITEELYMRPEEKLLINDMDINLPLHFTAVNGFCRKLKPDPEIPVQEIMSEGNFEVYLSDPGKSMYFSTISNSYKGIALATRENTKKLYTIHLEEIHWLEKIGECTNYGEEEAAYKTYDDCVAATQYEFLLQPLLGCSVPWLGGPDQTQSRCEGRVNLTAEMFRKTSIVFQGILDAMKYRQYDLSKYCLKPCTEVHSTSTAVLETSTPHAGLQGIGLYFNQNSDLTEEMLAYGFFDLLVAIGSSLGLWIGLSVIGIFDLTVAVGEKGRKHF